ncbi:MAG: glycosyltransferase family 2 protein [Chitinophagaceae bacterium]
MQISVIIPVYNVVPYIERCLVSLLNQDYLDFEIILVDNNSTDGSIEVASSFLSAQETLPFQLLSEPVPGSCMARKKGVEHANGEYICFIDADDEAYPNMLRVLMDAQVQNTSADIVVASYKISHNDVLMDATVQETLPKGLLGRREALSVLLADRQKLYLWRTLFKKKLFDGITYPVNSILEDLQVLPLIYNNAASVLYLNVPVVLYKIRDGSLSNPGKKLNVKKIASIPERISYMRETLIRAWQSDSQMINRIYYFDFITLRSVFVYMLCGNLSYDELKPLVPVFQSHYDAKYLRYMARHGKMRSVIYILKLKLFPKYLYAKEHSRR